MAYRFELSETPQAGLRRIARGQAGKVVRQLSDMTDEETAVHESRKALKRLKALFKLVRRGLQKPVYKREYGVIRDVGRSLAGPRDLAVLPLTLAALQRASDRVDAATSNKLLAAITQSRAEHDRQYDRTTVVGEAIMVLENARRRYGDLQLSDDGFAALAKGAGNGLGVLHKQHDRARASGIAEDYHEWRKSAQLHWRHLRLLSECWPEMLAARLRSAKALAEVLGHDHDLAVLAQFVSSPPASGLKSANRNALLKLIRARQKVLRGEAHIYADLLLQQQPEEFAGCLAAYHDARCAFHSLKAPLCDPFALPQISGNGS